MRRKLLLFVIVGMAGVLTPLLAVLAQSYSAPSTPASSSPATCTTNRNPAASSTDGKIIDEMIEILKETKLEKTFVVTALALGSMGSEAKRALPQLIRNAERLGLLDDPFGSAASKGDREVSQHIAEAIVMLAAGQPMGYLSVKETIPDANGSYGSPPVGGPYQPGVVPQDDPPSTYTTPAEPSFAPPARGGVSAPTPAAPTPAPSRAKTNTSRKESKPRTPVTPPPYAR